MTILSFDLEVCSCPRTYMNTEDLVIKTVFVTKDFPVKSNLLL